MSATVHYDQLNCLGCDLFRKVEDGMICCNAISFRPSVPQNPDCYEPSARRTPRLVVIHAEGTSAKKEADARISSKSPVPGYAVDLLIQSKTVLSAPAEMLLRSLDQLSDAVQGFEANMPIKNGAIWESRT
jgi:hypothetical protein